MKFNDGYRTFFEEEKHSAEASFLNYSLKSMTMGFQCFYFLYKTETE